MKRFIGYCAHLASVRLHDVAVWGMRDMECFQVAHPPLVNMSDQFGSFPMHMRDVAPRLAAAVDVVRRKLERMRTVALRRIGL